MCLTTVILAPGARKGGCELPAKSHFAGIRGNAGIRGWITGGQLFSTGCGDESHWPGIGGPFFDKNLEYALRQPKELPMAPRAPQRQPNGTPKGAKWSPKATNWTPRGAKWTPKGAKWSPKSRQGKPKTHQRHQKEAKGTSYIFTNSRSTATERPLC